MNLKSSVEKKMKKCGHRSSVTRDAVISIFQSSNKPLSVPEILELMKEKDIKVNKTTVYREIEKLQNHSILKEVYLGADKLRYELGNTEHHHHVVCINCDRVDDVPIDKDVESHERKIEQKLNYKVLNHSLEFFGVCKSCQ